MIKYCLCHLMQLIHVFFMWFALIFLTFELWPKMTSSNTFISFDDVWIKALTHHDQSILSQNLWLNVCKQHFQWPFSNITKSSIDYINNSNTLDKHMKYSDIHHNYYHDINWIKLFFCHKSVYFSNEYNDCHLSINCNLFHSLNQLQSTLFGWFIKIIIILTIRYNI